MSDASQPSPNVVGRTLDELRRRLARAPVGAKEDIFETWVRENVQAGASDEQAHAALALREIVREVLVDAVQVQRKKLVLVIHGIRDQGEWMEMVKVRLEREGIVVQPIDFEFFDVLRFMTGFRVKKVIERVLAKIRHAKANNDGAELIIIAHSFGTYVVACILRDEPDIRCSRAIFCGSVVPRSFRFDRVAYCPRIVNECGGRDIWPVIAQGFSIGRRYGAAGVWGLRASGVEDRFHDYGHSDYLTPNFVDTYWKPYIEDNDLVRSPYQDKRRSAPWCISLLSFGWWLTLPGLLFALLSVGAVGWLWNTGFTWWAAGVGVGLLVAFLAFMAWLAMSVYSYCCPPLAGIPVTGTMPPANPPE